MMPNSRQMKNDSTAMQLLRGVVEQNAIMRAALEKIARSNTAYGIIAANALRDSDSSLGKEKP